MLKYLGGTNYSVIIKSYEASENEFSPFITVSYTNDTGKYIGEGVYWFSSKAANGPQNRPRLMDVEGNNPALNTEIQQWDSVSPENNKYRAQLFYVKYCENGLYQIIPFTNPNNYIKREGSKVVSVNNSNIQNTYWKFEGDNTNGYAIVNATGDNYAITVPDSTSNGLPLELTNKNPSANNQNRWQLHRFDCYVLTIVAEPDHPFEPSGHAYLVFQNTSFDVAKVGYVTVLPENYVTFGTYGKLGFIGSFGGSSKREGIFYNRDFYTYQNSNSGFNGVALTDILTKDELISINRDYLKNPDYNDWSLLGSDNSNCVCFAQLVWNSISDYTVDGRSWGVYKPWVLKTSIMAYSWHLNNIELFEVGWYGIYDDSDQMFKYIYGASGAYPIVPSEVIAYE